MKRLINVFIIMVALGSSFLMIEFHKDQQQFEETFTEQK